MNPIDIEPRHLEMVCRILAQYFDDTTKVWVFGSRANLKARRASDLDLAIDMEKKVPPSIMVKLEDRFEASGLPYTVDIVDLHNADDNFRKIIEAEKILLPWHVGQQFVS
mgnify:CR=1 FL=1